MTASAERAGWFFILTAFSFCSCDSGSIAHMPCIMPGCIPGWVSCIEWCLSLFALWCLFSGSCYFSAFLFSPLCGWCSNPGGLALDDACTAIRMQVGIACHSICYACPTHLLCLTTRSRVCNCSLHAMLACVLHADVFHKQHNAWHAHAAKLGFFVCVHMARWYPHGNWCFAFWQSHLGRPNLAFWLSCPALSQIHSLNTLSFLHGALFLVVACVLPWVCWPSCISALFRALTWSLGGVV